MIEFSDFELNEYINSDVAFFDLTTYLQNCNDKKAQLQIYTREDIVVACIEEACKIARLLGCEVTFFEKSKTLLKPDSTLLTFEGDYNNIHKAWRVIQILLEYSCKIATKAHNMKTKIDSVNKNCELLTTRKTFPFSKKFCIKSSIIGGAMPHRLGLSETIVFFDAHRIIYKSNEEFYKFLNELKVKVPEKKIVVESEEIEDIKALLKCNVDVLQLDKLSFELLKKVVEYKNENYPKTKILAAGGINEGNVLEYAKCGVDGIVTSSVYNAGMANLGSKIKLI